MFQSVDEIPIAIALCVISYCNSQNKQTKRKSYSAHEMVSLSSQEVKTYLDSLVEEVCKKYDKRRMHLNFLVKSYSYFSNKFIEKPENIELHWKNIINDLINFYQILFSILEKKHDTYLSVDHDGKSVLTNSLNEVFEEDDESDAEEAILISSTVNSPFVLSTCVVSEPYSSRWSRLGLALQGALLQPIQQTVAYGHINKDAFTRILKILCDKKANLQAEKQDFEQSKKDHKEKLELANQRIQQLEANQEKAFETIAELLSKISALEQRVETLKQHQIITPKAPSEDSERAKNPHSFLADHLRQRSDPSALSNVPFPFGSGTTYFGKPKKPF